MNIKKEKLNGREVVVMEHMGVIYMNVTDHDFSLMDKNGDIVELPPSTLLVHVSLFHEVVATDGDIELLRETHQGEESIEDILTLARGKGWYTIGSIIAKRAYPGLIFTGKIAPGYEAVPPAKRVQLAYRLIK